jgi:hypothetical protein
MNQMSANDASFHDATGIADESILPRHITAGYTLNQDYSTTEQDTGIKDENGDKIYQRTFTGTLSGTGRADAPLLAKSYVKKCIDATGYFIFSSNANDNSIAIGQNLTTAANSTWVTSGVTIETASGLALRTFSGEVRTNAPYSVTIWYTKN